MSNVRIQPVPTGTYEKLQKKEDALASPDLEPQMQISSEILKVIRMFLIHNPK